MSPRYVVLGLGQARSGWFGEVTRWANAGSVPVEFVKVLSAAELHARLASPRRYSAVLLDETLPAVDRDLLARARSAGASPIVVGGNARRAWLDLGAAAVLAPDFTRDALLETLRAHAVGLERAETSGPGDPEADAAGLGTLVAVCGAGGTGVSTVAASLAAGLAQRAGSSVVLADLARHAEQAMLHAVGDIAPGVIELVDGHRGGRLEPAATRDLTFSVEGSGYRLLLGLRRARQWTLLRPAALAEAMRSLRTTFAAVVCDCDADVEGEESGSSDVADRNAMARAALLPADVVVVVGRTGVKGTHSTVRVVADLIHAGVEPSRVLPVLNLAPRRPSARAAAARDLAELVRSTTGEVTGPVVFLPARRVEDAAWIGRPAIPALGDVLAGAVLSLSAIVGGRREEEEPAVVSPGSLSLGETSW